MLYKRKQVIVKAVQFDPTVKPWPSGIHPWDNEPVRPRDMSWGYIVVNGNRTHVMAGDWLVSWEGRVWKVEREAFAELYEELPGAAAALANTTQYPLSASGSLVSRAINDGAMLHELEVVIEASVGDGAAADWETRMKQEGWALNFDGVWENNANPIYPEIAARLNEHNLTPCEALARHFNII